MKKNTFPTFKNTSIQLNTLILHLVVILSLISISRFEVEAQASSSLGTSAGNTVGGGDLGNYSGGNFDNVNVFNGNLNFNLPLLQIGGRGQASYTPSLAIFGKWYVRNETICGNNPPNDCENYAFPDFRNSFHSESASSFYNGPGNLYPRYADGFGLVKIIFDTQDGTSYELTDTLTMGRPSQSLLNRGRVFRTTDGSNITFVSDRDIFDLDVRDGYIPPHFTGYLYFPGGVRYRIDRVLISTTNGDFYKSKVTRIEDQNGNFLTFEYGAYPSGDIRNLDKLVKVTDSLGRIVTFNYNVQEATPYGLCDVITYRGFNNQEKKIRISRKVLSDGLLTSGSTIKLRSQLFPESYLHTTHPNSPDYLFDPLATSAIWLSDGRSYKFKYDSYGRLSRVELPTGSILEYTWGSGVPNSNTGAYLNLGTPDIHQRVLEKRIYSNEGNSSAKTKFGLFQTPFPPPQYQISKGYVDVDVVDGNMLISRVRHSFYGAPIQETPITSSNYCRDECWKSGFEYKTEWMGSDGSTLLRKVIKTWQNTPPQWWIDQPPLGSTPTANVWYHEPITDPRPTQQIAIDFEAGNALAVLMKTEYDEAGSTDPGHLSHLNVKRKKSYNYKVLDSNTAQNGTIETIAGMFSESDLASVTETDYLYEANYKARGITSLPIETRVMNPANPTEVLARSQILYDEQSEYYSMTDYGSTVGYIAPTGPYSHLRGNATTFRTWFAEENRWIETHTQYDNFGNMRKAWDSSDDQNRFVETEYSPDYYYAYPTQKITKGAGDGIHGTTEDSAVSAIYDFWTGLITSATNANGQVTSTEYDNLLRPKKIIPPAGGGITEKIYGDTPGNFFVTTKTQVDAQNWAETTAFMDNLGKVYKTRTKDLQGDIFLEIEYDNLGRVKRVSNPYRQGEQKYWSKPRYDNQGRVVETYAPAPDGQTGASTGAVEFGISTMPGLVGNYVTATDASGRKARSFTNVYGQTVRVDEPTGNNNLGELDNPNQASYYYYNVKGELVIIKQGNQNQTCGTTAQCRYFMYDSLGRLTRVRQPEQIPPASLATTGNPDNNQWTSGFTYDVFGNVATVTDAKGMTITNEYDKAGRITKSSYNDNVTPQVDYFYDGTGLPQVPQFAKGSLTKISNGVSETRYTSFDNYGKVLKNQQITDGRNFDLEYKYDGVGNLIEQTYPSGRVVKTHLDADGGLAAVSSKTANSPFKTYASNFNYAATGDVKAMMLGNGRWETTVFNERQQAMQMGLGNTSTDASLWKANYEYGELNADGTVDANKNIGMVGKQTTSLTTTTFVQTYKYDALNRLTEAKENANTTSGAENWKQTFDYDRYGNRTSFYQKVGNNVLPVNNITKPQIDPATNRFTTGQGYVYDFSGNLVQDAENRGFTYDGDDKQTVVRDLNIPTTTQNPNANVIGRYFYDGEGKRVKKVTNLETTIFVYDGGGTLVAEYSTQTNPNPTTSYLTTDNLGSPRVITDNQGNVISRRDFMPFGEEILAGVGARDTNMKYSASGIDNIRQRFTGYEKDVETDLDFAQARMYKNSHGRFTAPDPLISSAGLDNPQTFNRYIYVGNNPINITDPSGLNWCKGRDNKIQWVDGNCSSETTDITGQYGVVLTVGPEFSRAGANVGAVVRYDDNHKITVINNPTDAQWAQATGTQVQGSSDPVEMTNSFPGSAVDLLPLPCPDGRCNSTMAPPPPRLTEGASAEEIAITAQITLDLIGATEIPLVSQGAEAINIGIDAINGDAESVLMGTVSLVPAAGSTGTATKIAKRLKKLAEINGNSKLSEKAQHLYEVFETSTSNVVKTGISDGKIRKDGKSYRAEKQKRKWNRAEGEGKYDTRVVKKIAAGKGARVKALAAEIKNANKHRRTLDSEKHKYP